MSQDKEQVTFAEAKGTEANQQAKKLAQAKSKKKAKKYPKYYSQSGTKVISVCCKPNGAYKEYVGNMAKKKEVSLLKAAIEKWNKEGLWVPEHELEKFCTDQIAKLNK